MSEVRDIVTQILQSPQLRQSLEITVRSITSTSASSQAAVVLPTISESRPPLQQEIRRLFPSIRERNSSSNRIRSRVTSRRLSAVTFCKDVILLKSPNSYHTLRGSLKSMAYETGFAVSAVQFNSVWSYAEIQTHIRSIFSLLNNIDFELVQPVGGRLTKIVLQQGIDFNGYTLRRIFHQKIIYVRPLVNLCDYNDYNPEEQFEAPNLVCNDMYSMPTSNSTVESTLISANNDDHNNTEISSLETPNIQPIVYSNLYLEDILRNIRMNIKETVSQFNIYRQDIFQCCIRAMQRKTFDPFNKIDVKFSDIEGLSEGAVDVGGPTREMFRLVLAHIKSSRMFTGNEKKFLTLNSVSLQNKEYFYAGRIIALSLLHGGPGPHFFSETLFTAVIDGTDKCIPSKDFLDYDIADKIQTMLEINNLVDLKEYIVNETIFAIAGVYGINDISDRDNIIQETMKFYNFHRVRPAFDQFVEGLQTCNIYNLMVDYPDSFKKVMCNNKPKLTSSIFQDTFEIVYNEIGSNKRQIENRVMAFFRDYLLDCEDEEAEISLTDLLVFATGADTVPPLGFPWKPKLVFLHESISSYPKGNTCGLELQLPVIHEDYMKFKYQMDFGVGNSKDFAFS